MNFISNKTTKLCLLLNFLSGAGNIISNADNFRIRLLLLSFAL